MPRSIWKGAISFGLVTIPIKVYGATEQKDVSFHQVHVSDQGRIKYKRVCEKCGQEVEYSDIAKGYQAPDGRIAILEKQDFEELPLATAKAVEVVQFIDADTIDPLMYDKPYYLEADGAGVKPYVLLRDALRGSQKAAVVKVALRSRESIALIRVVDDVLVLQTLLWPDEVRDAGFATPPVDINVSEAEVAMAKMFIDQMTGTFDPAAYTDSYREALERLVEAKLTGASVDQETGEETKPADVVDLVAALRASVEAAKKKREQEQAKAETTGKKAG